MEGKTFGSFIKEKRLKKKYSLRRFCTDFNLDPGNHSKLERGLISPSPKSLKQLAAYLGIALDSQEFKEMSDLASLQQGRIPKDILSDKELMHKMPLFFRTIRNIKPDENDISLLYDVLKSEFKEHK